MGSGVPGCGSKWDGLMHIDYGMLKALYNASEDSEKEVDIWIVNFSTKTRMAGPFPLQQFYEARSGSGKDVMLLPQSDLTHLSTKIFPMVERQLNEGRTVWSFATDGDITNDGAVYTHIERILGQPDHSVLFFQLFSQSDLGTKLDALQHTKPNLYYKEVTDMDQILQASMSVLVQYDRQMAGRASVPVVRGYRS
jgi:hypothetical protein